MTAPLPPANLYGRTAKEILGYGGQFGAGGQSAGAPILPFFTLSGFGVVMTQQPAAMTYYGWLNRPWYDAGWATHVRLVTDIAVAGAPGAYFLMQRCTDTADPDDDANWGTVGEIRNCTVPIDVVGPQKSVNWVKLSALAKGENLFRVVAVGGDGILSPEHGLLWAEFRYQRPSAGERWYWRTAAPGDVFSWDNPNTLYINTDIDSPLQEVWLTPTPATVTANQSVLSRTKNSSGPGTTASSTSTDAHIDVSGVMKRFIGAPLRAQTIPPWTYRMGFASQAPSGGVGGGYVLFQIGIFRPTAPTAPLVLWQDEAGVSATWHRYVTKQLVATLDVATPFDVQDGDRYFVDLIGIIEIASGALSTTNGLGLNIGYNGAGLEEFVHGADLGGNDPASWIEMPLLAYWTKDAT